jgi:5'-nucleotidase
VGSPGCAGSRRKSRRFHSVVQHAVLVSKLLIKQGRADLALAGLHHDSHEAYVCDLPSPLKRKLEAAGQTLYEEVCDALDEVIATALGIPELSEEGKAAIKAADNQALMIEAAKLLPDCGAGIAADTKNLTARPPASLGRSWSPEEARERFLQAHERLAHTNGRG